MLFFPLGLCAQKEKSTVTETLNGKKYYIHTVEKEQTLYSISKIYTITVNDIVIENPEAIDGIKAGQKLKIPYPKTTTAAIPAKQFTKEDSLKYTFHKVEKNQTLYSLSKQYEITIDELQKINPEIKDGLKEGQILKISRPKKVKELVVKKDSVTIQRPNSTMLPVTTIPDSIMFQRKAEYNIALFLPFNLSLAEGVDVDRVAKGDATFPGKADVAVSFYQGVLIAIDSLKQKGFSCKLFVYDIDENDSAELVKILNKPELKEMDLILGPLYYSNVKDVTKFANTNKIHNVSPLSQLNKILFNNPYTSKIVPSSITQVEQLGKYITEKYSKENILIVGARKDVASFNAIKKTLNESAAMNKTDTIPVVASLAATTEKLSSSKKNIIVFPSNDQAYVTDFLTKLHGSAGKFDISVFGMSSWRGFDNIDPDYTDTLHLHLPMTFYIDYTDSATLDFIKKYRTKYFADPQNFTFQGYDVAMFYLQQLHEYGANFHFKLNGADYKGLQSNFVFYKTAEGSGYDNSAVYIFKQQNHRFIKIK